MPLDDPFAAYQQAPDSPSAGFAAGGPKVYTKNNTLPPDLPGKAVRMGASMLPAVGAAVGTMLAPEAAIPAIGAAILGGGIGSAAKQGINYAAGNEDAPKSWGDAAKDVGVDALAQGAMEAGGRVISGAAKFVGSQFTPKALYGRALAPSRTLKVGEQNARIQTGLREGIPTGEQGWEETWKRINDASGKTKDYIASKPNVPTIDPEKVATHLDDIEALYRKGALSGDQVKAVQHARQAYLEKHGAEFDPETGQMTTKPNWMTPMEAQEEKQATYELNKKSYEAAARGNTNLNLTQDAAEKALAHGLMEELAAKFPALTQLNGKTKELLDLEDSLRRVVGRERTRHVAGLMPFIGAGAGMLAGHPAEGAALGMAASLTRLAVENPDVQAKLAIALFKAGNSGTAQVLGKAANATSKVINLPTAMRAAQAYGSAQLAGQPKESDSASTAGPALPNVGDTKFLQGKPVKITKVYEDGSVDYTPVQ